MRASLWSRVKDLVARLFRRKPPEPGRFATDTKWSWRGLLAVAPLVLPQREYLVYIPAGASHLWQWRSRPLLVLLHGCRQSPEDIAASTRVTKLADELDCVVLLPRQAGNANPWGCWNWFDSATARGRGETAIVAAQIEVVLRRYRIDSKRVFAAGLSSGGGLAAALGVRRPDLIAGTFVHSGVACGAASSPLAALGILTHGADTDFTRIATEARAEAAADALPVPLVVIHGARDATVAPVNAAQLVRQYLTLNAHPAASVGENDALPVPDRADSTATPEGRTVTTSEWRSGGRLVARHVLVSELGHAWSGGDDHLPFNDPLPPDATALLSTFIGEAMQ